MSMGSPYWAQYMFENPVLAGENPPTPNFSYATFNTLYIGSVDNLETLSDIPYSEGYNTQLDGLTYGSYCSPNPTWASCFAVAHT